MKKSYLSDLRVGETKNNKWGSSMEIVDYNNVYDLTVKFLENGNMKKSSYKQFQKGNIRNPYDKTVYGVGFIGEGEIDTRIYKTWQSMIERCYYQKLQEKYPTYKGCTMSEEWYNYQIFAKWYMQNFYAVEDERMCLDKDILIKGNKHYSQEKCVFVPHKINCLFIKSNKRRGGLPIGVSLDKKLNKYRSHASNHYIGYFNTSTEAFASYKEYKEKMIKRVANEYKDKIPEILYKALIDYEVEITD